MLRPVFFMQNLFAMVRDGTVATAARDGRVAMIDARDIAAAAVAALHHLPAEGRIYTLTGPEAVSSTRWPTCSAGGPADGLRHVRVPAEAVCERLRAAGAEPGSPPTWLRCTACSPTDTRTSSRTMWPH